jgi:nitrite reductase/ring-hydroxylating ferredoxin subunit
MAFVRVAEVAEIPDGHGALFETGGLTVAIFNAGAGRFYATSPLCPHEDGPLAEGWIEGNVVVCPWHGWDFELQTGRCRVDPGLAIGVYDVRVRDGGVEVDLP